MTSITEPLQGVVVSSGQINKIATQSFLANHDYYIKQPSSISNISRSVNLNLLKRKRVGRPKGADKTIIGLSKKKKRSVYLTQTCLFQKKKKFF